MRSSGLPAAGILAAALLLQPYGAPAHETGSTHLHAFGEVGCRLLDGEAFVALRPGVVIESERLHLIIAPLLHLGFAGDGAYLRAEDLDAPGDYGRALYLLEAEGIESRWSLRAGALANERLGNGALLDGWTASLDPDGPRTALRFDVHGDAVGLEAIMSGLLDPVLFAARLSAAPVAAAGGEGRASRALTVGVTGALDPTAPIETTGELGAGRRPEASTSPIAHAAIDARLTLYEDHRLLLEPYADGVVTVAGPRRGRGAAHVGLALGLATERGPSIMFEAELRRLGSGYLPVPFDALYSIERWGFPVGEGKPKAVVDGVGGGLGGKGEVTMEWDDAGIATFSVEGRALGPSSATIGVALEQVGPVSMAGVLALRGIGWSGSQASPWWLGMAEARWLFTDAFYLAARGGRTFRVDQEQASYRPAWDASLLLGAVL